MNADVIIIDSGVNSLLANRIIGGINLSGVGNSDDIHDSIGHGSSVLNLILNKNPEASVYMVKVCDNYNGFSFDKLCEALEYIVSSNIICKILNISMGIIRLDNYPRLHDLIVRIREQGIVIVSAYQNQGVISYPAGFEEVIGVDCSPSCGKRDEFEYIKGSIVDVRASSAFYHAFDSNQNKILSKGTSYAAANLTGLILKNADNYDGIDYFDKCLHYLKTEAVNSIVSVLNPQAYNLLKYHSRFTSHINPKSNISPFINDTINDKQTSFGVPKWTASGFSSRRPKAIVFPFNKEMHSIARFESMLQVEIVGYYDYRISINNYKKVSSVLGCDCSDKSIKPIDELEWNSSFELVICGHCHEISMMTGDNILGNIISKCIEHGKKLYSFDDPFGYLKHNPNFDISNVFFPYIDKSMLVKNRFNKLRNASKPVLGVYGTSSQQGKHTLQLYLRKELIKKGYKVGQLGTEPHGYLFGFDFVYPMGYNASVYVDGYDAISILNEAIWDIEKTDPDIIITGCQSGTVPYNINYLSNINLSTFDFYLGTAPDAVILCINPFDKKSYIKKTIKFLEGLGNARVIALAMFPIIRKSTEFELHVNTRINDTELEIIRKDFEQSFNIATFVNREENVDEMSNEIIRYFGG